MNLILSIIFGVVLTLNIFPVKAEETGKPDEMTLRNQLFADVFILREGVDRLQINVEVLNKRYNNQMDILKSIQTKLLSGNNDFEEEDSVCDRITGMFNATFRKYNAFENRIVTKLDEIHDEQSERFDEILLKQKSSRVCSSKGDSSGNTSLLSTTLMEISEKIDKFEEKMNKLESLEAKFNVQQTKLDKFVETQLKVLQEINEKLTKNTQQYESFGQELAKIKELKSNVNHIVTNPRPKLPMEVILGLSSANITTLK